MDLRQRRFLDTRLRGYDDAVGTVIFVQSTTVKICHSRAGGNPVVDEQTMVLDD